MSLLKSPRRAVAPCVLGLLGALLSGGAAAGPTGYQYFVLGAGDGMIVHLQPCPDIPCNAGDMCSCITANGGLKAHIEDGKHFIPGSFTLEVSADDSALINNGSGGLCYGSTGKLGITVPQGTLAVPFSGLACHIPDGNGNRTFGISAPASVASGTGAYTTPDGTGAFSGTFSPTSGKVVFDLTGFAQFHK